MRVGVFIITDKEVMPECLESVKNQDYPNFFYIINVKKPRHRLGGILKDKDILENREEARKRILKTDAELILILDSDIVLPKDAISQLVMKMNTNIKVLGAYIPGIPKYIGKMEHWCGGFVVNGNEFLRLTCRFPGVSKVDICAVGCVMVRREVLEKVKFKAWKKPLYVTDVLSKNPKMLYDECCDFSAQVVKAGYSIFMDGDVVCKHLAHI